MKTELEKLKNWLADEIVNGLVFLHDFTGSILDDLYPEETEEEEYVEYKLYSPLTNTEIELVAEELYEEIKQMLKCDKSYTETELS